MADQMPHRLSKIPLRWMIRETFKTNSGIMFNSQALRRIGLDPSGLYKTVRDRPPPIVLGDDETRREREPSTAADKGRHRVNGVDGKIAVHAHGEDGLVVRRSEEEEDLEDALTPIHDRLKTRWAWWILEILPRRFRVQSADREWHWRWS